MNKIKIITNKILRNILGIELVSASRMKMLKADSSRMKKLDIELEKQRRRISQLEQLILDGRRDDERQCSITVSMTSFPPRIGYVSSIVRNMMCQTMQPDRIVLWLSEEQFPEKEDGLPKELIALCAKGLEICWCQGDMKAYKKLLPSLEKYPNDILIIIDDDLVYDNDLIECLYEEHKSNPKAIIASRVHKMTLGSDGRVDLYNNWDKETFDRTATETGDLFVTGGAGTLIPPGVFDEEIFNYDIIKEYCLNADDIWLNLMSNINGIEIINRGINTIVSCIEGTQEERLWTTNKFENDTQLRQLAKQYENQLNGIWTKIL